MLTGFSRVVEPSTERQRRQRRLSPAPVLLSATALAAVPVLVSAGLGWSAALPASAAMLATGFLALTALRELRPAAPAVAPVRTAPASSFACLDRLPGLVTRHDAAGQLVAAHGLDRAALGFAGPVTSGQYLDAIHISGRIAFLQAIDALRQGAATATAEYRLAPQGDADLFRPVRATLSAEFDADGAFSGFIAQTVDVSAELALAEEAASWRAEAQTANDAKTRFLAAVSHELRTPLNAILGFSDILIGEYFGKFENARQKEYVQLVNQSGHHLLAVVNSMLDMSKIEAGRYELIKEPFHIADAVRAVDEMLALEAKNKGVVLATRVARGLDEVVADRRAVQQILINLANNAIKFTKEGGVVTIDANGDARHLVITVADTGIGIPADRLASIGKPFVQVQNDYTRQYEGTGLGLALVKGLVALHGGTFEIESSEGKGTVITVRLPTDGEGDADAAAQEFPPRLREQPVRPSVKEDRDGAAEAKIA